MFVIGRSRRVAREPVLRRDRSTPRARPPGKQPHQQQAECHKEDCKNGRCPERNVHHDVSPGNDRLGYIFSFQCNRRLHGALKRSMVKSGRHQVATVGGGSSGKNPQKRCGVGAAVSAPGPASERSNGPLERDVPSAVDRRRPKRGRTALGRQPVHDKNRAVQHRGRHESRCDELAHTNGEGILHDPGLVAANRAAGSSHGGPGDQSRKCWGIVKHFDGRRGRQATRTYCEQRTNMVQTCHNQKFSILSCLSRPNPAIRSSAHVRRRPAYRRRFFNG